MQKFIESTGRNEDEAIRAALEQLHLERDEVSVEILQRAKSGFFGFRSSPAKIRVTYEVPDEGAAPVFRAETPPEPETEEIRQRPVKQKREKKPEKPPRQPERPAAAPEREAPKESLSEQGNGEAAQDKVERINQFLTGLMERMQVNAVPETVYDGDGIYRVNLRGENLGAVIGRRGETLDAIQQLTGYCVNRGAARRSRIQVDAENYRAKREESLIRLANRAADKVVKYHRNMTLEPMNAYERHVIHTALQEHPGVTTFSTGTEPYRRVVIACEKS